MKPILSKAQAIKNEFQQMLFDHKNYDVALYDGYSSYIEDEYEDELIRLNWLEDMWLADDRNNTFIEYMDDEYHRDDADYDTDTDWVEPYDQYDDDYFFYYGVDE